MADKQLPTAEEANKTIYTSVPYTPEEFAYRGYTMQKMMSSVVQKNTNWPEFDDQNHHQWYDTNGRAACSYNAPKENEEDTRIVTGTTQEKEATLLSAILNYNLEANVQAFDKDSMEYVELGENMEDMIRKSREIEDYDMRRPLIYKEMFDQGTVFVEEVSVERMVSVKKMKNKDWSMGGVNPSKIKWDTKLKKLYAECQVNLLPGTNVFLGNIREFFIDKQPYLFTRDTIPYNEAAALFSGWERFQYVPRKVTPYMATEGEVGIYRDWSVIQCEENMVEVIKFQDPIKNEFQIFLNGVMMLPIEFPLTEISPSGRFTIAKGDVEPISRWFAYSKSVPAKTKVDQGLLDEVYRLLILKMKKSLMPPMANNTNKHLSRRVLFPGKITRDIDVTKFVPIGGEEKGITPAEFTFFQTMKQMIDEKSVQPVFSGDIQKGNATATQIIEQKKQQMMKLGLAIWGVISLEKQLAYLRLHNILATWTKKVDERVDPIRKQIQDVYRSVSVDSTFPDGRKGTKVIEFNPELAQFLGSNPNGPAMIEKEEELLSEPGRPVRKVYLDPKELRTIDMHWYINITPTEKETTELQRVLFVQNIKDAAELFGPQSLNVEHLKHRFALLAKEDPDKFFTRSKPQPQPGMPPEGGPAGGTLAAGITPPGGGGAIPAQLMQAAGAGGKQPGLSQLLGG